MKYNFVVACNNLSLSILKTLPSLKRQNMALCNIQIFNTNKRSCNFLLLVFFCGRETWSLTLRGERRLSVFENRVLRKMYGPRGTT